MQLVRDEKSGITFEVYRPSKEEEHNTIFNVPTEAETYEYNDIWAAYEKPSATKVSVWYAWKGFFRDHDGYCFISSRNCMKFSISGFAEIVDDETGEMLECNMWITKDHNRAYVLNW